MVGVIVRSDLFGVFRRRSSKCLGAVVGADVELVVDTEGKFGETGRGPVFDRLPNSRLIHVHILIAGR